MAYYSDESLTLHHGNAVDVLATLPEGSADCIVTSPPYFGLRDYGADGQIGAEASPAEFVAAVVAVFREARRVLADDGTLWLNLGDSYYSGRGNPGPNSADAKNPARRGWARPLDKPGQSWGTQKNLLGIPWRVAFALQDDGWILRNDIIWAKPNAMPESVTDRLSTRHEHLFLLTKKSRYWFDLEPIREPHKYAIAGTSGIGGWNGDSRGVPPTGAQHLYGNEAGRNPGDVWTIATQPFPGAHFATMPPALAERCIQAGCKPGGTVLDPFSGSGTTGYAAARHGLRYVGIDLNAEYLDLSLQTRLAQTALLDGEGVA